MLFHTRFRKRCLVTLCIERPPYTDLAKFSLPLMARYAEAVGAAFYVIKEQKFSFREDWSNVCWEKFQVADLLKDFEKVLFVDLDCVIGRHCPDIFDYYEEDLVVCYFDFYPDEVIKEWFASKRLPAPTIRINSGVMLLDRIAGGYLRPPQTLPPVTESYMSEECWFAACFQHSRLPITKIDSRFNDWHLDHNTWIHHAMKHQGKEKTEAVRFAAAMLG